jgi:hypothetical protein
VYNPNCAFACRGLFASALLECSSHDHASGAHSHHSPGPTSAACYAGDTPFLTTVANCINMTCTDIEPWKLEKYWAEQITKDVTVVPKWSLHETLTHMANMEPPTQQLGKNLVLNFTAAFDQRAWDRTRGTMNAFEYAEVMNSRTRYVKLLMSCTKTQVTLTPAQHHPSSRRLRSTHLHD